MVAPMVLTASPNSQGRQEERREERRERQRRYYDREHRDYHAWTVREDGAYRRWRVERHYRTHPAFYRLRRKERAEYWKWRHEHPDHDGDRR